MTKKTEEESGIVGADSSRLEGGGRCESARSNRYVAQSFQECVDLVVRVSRESKLWKMEMGNGPGIARESSRRVR